MSEIDRAAAERVMRARAELIQSHTFYGVLVSNVEPKPSRVFPTMATNGATHFYNPDYIMKLTPKQVLGVQRHESEHDGRRHHTRRGKRDPREWNICTDLAINIDLVDEGVELPPGALVDAKYRGWSAEDIYRARELDRLKEQQEQEKQRQQQNPSQDAEDGKSGGDGDGDDGDREQQPDGGDADQQPDGDRDQDGDDGDTHGDKPGDDEADEAGDAEGQGGGEPGEEPGDEAGAAGSDDASGNEPSDEAAGASAADGGADGEPDGQTSSAPMSCGDPGGCGEVLDAPAEEPADIADEDGKWERILRQAASLAAKRGNAPGHVSREIERADKPPQDWRETLRAWFDQGAARIETWARPNRRFISSGIYLPGSQRDGINRAVFLIDTSGSMDKIALACINTEAQAALDEGIIDEAVVIYGDTRVTRVDTYRSGDQIEFDPRGGGGTRLNPLFDYVRDQLDDVSLIVCFTDMEIGDPGPEPAAPVLFAATGYPDKVRRYLADAPWGAPGIDVGSH
jgi:predicted metal-dependent peptidase